MRAAYSDCIVRMPEIIPTSGDDFDLAVRSLGAFLQQLRQSQEPPASPWKKNAHCAGSLMITISGSLLMLGCHGRRRVYLRHGTGPPPKRRNDRSQTDFIITLQRIPSCTTAVISPLRRVGGLRHAHRSSWIPEHLRPGVNLGDDYATCPYVRPITHPHPGDDAGMTPKKDPLPESGSPVHAAMRALLDTNHQPVRRDQTC